MQDSLRTGISFGLTSAVITTLGLMVGLHSGTHSKIVVLAGILTIAIADRGRLRVLVQRQTGMAEIKVLFRQ
ncbi:MAG: hypothetical protein JSV31_18140 [Desulfobacterales bacterium]|nr:MAG: hypothetical protein JSV31_18140 [Desulfobacterales bacterium]